MNDSSHARIGRHLEESPAVIVAHDALERAQAHQAEAHANYLRSLKVVEGQDGGDTFAADISAAAYRTAQAANQAAKARTATAKDRLTKVTQRITSALMEAEASALARGVDPDKVVDLVADYLVTATDLRAVNKVTARRLRGMRTQ